MIEKAIEKIKSEMQENKAMYIQVVGEYLLKQIEINKNAAESIVKEGKTIAGAVLQIASESKKNVEDGPGKNMKIGCVTDAEGFEIVRKYFGFEAVQNKILDVDVHEIKSDAQIEDKKTEIDFDVKLENLLDA